MRLSRKPSDPQQGRHFIRRLTFDLGSTGDSYEEEILLPDRSLMDLIGVDPRFLSVPYQFAFAGEIARVVIP